MRTYINIILSFLLLFTGFPLGAQTFPSNTIKFGDGANTDKKITANKGGSNPQLKYNATAASWQFSNDGTNFNDFGSGSGAGGGLNIISKNPDFEQGITNGWTSSGGTFAAVTSGSNLLFGKGSATFTASATGQYIQSDLYEVPVGLGAKNCLARLYYKGGDTTYLLRVLDNSSNVLASQALPAVATNTEVVPINFICPSSGTQIRLRLESTASAPIVAVDRTHLGEADNLYQLSQAKVLGTLKYASAGSCRWQLSVSTFTSFPADTDCPTPSLTGIIQAPGTKIPGLVIPSVGPGVLKVTAMGHFRKTNAAANWPAFRFFDGATGSGAMGVEASSLAATSPVLVGYFSYTTQQTNLTIQLQGGANSGTQDSEIYNEAGSSLDFLVEFLPSSSESAIRLEQINWLVNATMGGNFSLSLTTEASPIEMTDGGNSITNNTGINGVLAAQIACSGTNPSTGTTCAAGNESNGIAFTPPSTGDVKVCASATSVITNTSSGIDLNVILVETPNNAQTVLNTGQQTVQMGNGTAGGHITHEPFKICSIFPVTSVAKKTYRMFYSQGAAGLGSNAIQTIHWTAEPVNRPISAPYLVGSVVSGSTGVEKSERATLVCGSSSSITRQSGSWVSSVGNISSNRCALTLDSAAFTAAPTCTANLDSTSTSATTSVNVNVVSNTSLTLGCTSTAGGTTTACTGPDTIHLRCSGPK